MSGGISDVKKVIIVESPTKARKIAGFFQGTSQVLATFGHIRDLPKDRMGFSFDDILSLTKGEHLEEKFNWVLLKRRVVSYIKKHIDKLGSGSQILIATDPDREGEAIAWHIAKVLNIKNPSRIVFYEVTKKAIEDAIKNPRKIDMNLVYAQITRRILDRVVGYTISPIFWRVRKNSSAGRVQSAALHLIVNRWKEIRDFVKKAYYVIFTDFGQCQAFLYERYKDEEGNFRIRVKHFIDEEEVKAIVSKIKELEVTKCQEMIETRSPLPPYITSSLLQDAKNILGFSSDFTMKLAQSLFENGFITYHRTDSFEISGEGFRIAQEFLKDFEDIAQVGRKWKARVRNAQEAHEAIRLTGQGLNYFSKLYKDYDLAGIKKAKISPHSKLLFLIGLRFFSSQCKNAVYDALEINFSSPTLKPEYFFRLKVKKLKFPGFMKIWKMQDEKDEEELEGAHLYDFAYEIAKQGKIAVSPGRTPSVSYKKEYTSPPPLYTEATLIKTLEKLGIGRPSTYSVIIKSLKSRGYIMEEKGKIIPTPDGIWQDEILEKTFQKIISPLFTATMEEILDKISRGEVDWMSELSNMVRSYLDDFEKFKSKFASQVQESEFLPASSGKRSAKSSKK